MSKKSDKKPNRTNIGGQAVLEGVMMRGSYSMATAVRDEDGIIRLETKRIVPSKDKSFLFRMPIVRGAINFFSSLVSGMQTLLRSAEVYGGDEPTKLDNWLAKKLKIDIMTLVMVFGVVLGLGLSIFLFIACPQWITNFITSFTSIKSTDVAFNFIEGGIRILIFVLYILLTSLIKDIKRTYMYHGAEHKTISCYESGKPLTVENVRASSRVHDRCGTTFMFFVMLVSILVFSVVNVFLGGVTGILRILVKIALLPLVAGLSYELLKGLAKTDFFLFYPIKLPGLLLQRITTNEPEDSMIEVAITAFKTVLEMDADRTLPTQKFVTAMKISEVLALVKEKFNDSGIDESDAEWLVSIVANVKRSELSTATGFIAPKKVDYINTVVAERLTGRPLWYILGSAEFFGREFAVDERVLIPRPETEELVYNAISGLNTDSKVLDLCTGSGVIAVTVKLEKGCRVDATDISSDALEVAVANAKKHNAEITFYSGDLFGEIDKKYDMIISNPPYIPSEDISGLSREVSFEPRLALDGGADGLSIYRRIAIDAPKYLYNGGILIMECGVEEATSISEMLNGFSKVEIIKDMNGVERIIKAEL